MTASEWDDGQLGELRGRLEAVAEELADLGRAGLVRAVQAAEVGDGEARARAVAEERRVAAARRAVLRALVALGGEPGEGP